MKKPSAQPSVNAVLQRLSDAFGEKGHANWMARMEVQPETVRTWRKRGEVPPRQLMRASALTGRAVEWFTADASFHAEGEKQVISRTAEKGPPPGWEIEGLLTVMTVVLEELNEKALTLPPGKIVELVRLIYEHSALQPAAPRTLRRTTEQFLRLVA